MEEWDPGFTGQKRGLLKALPHTMQTMKPVPVKQTQTRRFLRNVGPNGKVNKTTRKRSLKEKIFKHHIAK